MTLGQLYHILKSRRHFALVLWICCVLAAMGVVSILPPLYSSSAQIFVNLTDTSNPANVQVPAAVVRNYIATQVETLRSRSTALAVVESERLDEDPVWRRAFAAAGEEGELKSWIANALLARLQINRLAASDLISVNYFDRSPEGAQRFANAFATAFVRRHLELSSTQSQEQVNWLTGRLNALRERLIEVETQRSEIRRSAVERGDVAAAGAPDNAASLPSVLAAARTTLIQARVAYQQAQAGQSVPVDGPELQQLRKQLGDIEVALARELPQLGPQHRRVQNFTANKEQLRAEIDRAVARQKAEYLLEKQREMVSAEQRVADLTEALKREEKVRDEQVVGRAQGANLDREIESLRAQVESLVQRREKSSVSAAASQSNVMVLSPAILPLEPSSPRTGLIMGLAVVFGLLFGVVAAFLAEMFDRRVRCVEDLTSYTPAPVLGHVARTRHSSRMVPSTARSATQAFIRRNRAHDRAPAIARLGSGTLN